MSSENVIILLIAAVVTTIAAMFSFWAGYANAGNSDTFKTVCRMQGGNPVIDSHYTPLCIKGGQLIPIEVH